MKDWRTRTFDIVAEWDPEVRAWAAEVPGMQGAHSCAKSLSSLDPAIREAIAGALDLPRGAEPELKLVWEYRVDSGEVDELAHHAHDLREQLREISAEAQRTAERAARRLRGKGLSVRDVARLTGVSHQRVSQFTIGRTA